MLYKLFFLLMCLFLFFLPEQPQAQWTITRADLERNNIDFFQFKPAVISHKGDMFIGYEFMDFENRKKGLVYGLRVFRFKAEGKFTVDTILLPITFFVSIALTDKDQSAIVVGNYGTKILKVNLKTSKVDTIFQYTPGKPGFRTENLVIGWDNKVYLSGYFYDKDQYAKNDAVVELNHSAPKAENIFTQTTNLTQAYKEIGGQPHIMYITSGNVIYFAFSKPVSSLSEDEKKKGNNMILYCWNKGKLQEIDRGTAIGNFAGTTDRVYYSIFKDRKNRFTYIKNLNDNKVWEIGQRGISYTYPFISTDSKTVVFCTVSVLDQRMNVYFAREQDNFKFKQLLQEVTIGPMKLSGDGKIYLVMSPDTIQVDTVKPISASIVPVQPQPPNKPK